MIENEVVVYRKNGITYVRHSGLYEGINIKDFSSLIGKSRVTILRHYKKLYPYSIIKNGKRLTLSIEEQVGLIQTFNHFEIKKLATRIPIGNEKVLIGNEKDLFIDEKVLNSDIVSLEPPEAIIANNYFINKYSFLAKEFDKDRQFMKDLYSGKSKISLTDCEKTIGFIYQDQDRGPL
jgi:hypothetical protein